MSKIRVLIVDDSVVVRRLLADVLSQDPAIEVVGSAATGKIALAMIDQVQPDVVTMDIEMPEMNGLTAVSEIRKTRATLPIIMFSTLSQRSAKETLDALTRGANDYVTKPLNVGNATLAMQRIRDELLPKIKALCLQKVPKAGACQPALPGQSGLLKHKPVALGASGHPITVVAIGVSTGGPNALADVIPRFPRDFPVPILIVQHMPPIFTKCLGERLSVKSLIPVAEGQPGTILSPGKAWIAPGDFHMTVQKRGNQVELVMNQNPPENSCRPAVDVLFRSVAEVYGAGVLGVVLTGMGQDGMLGAEKIQAQGGQILAQDEATSVVWGMPGAVVQAGYADKVLPLSCIAGEIVRKVQVRQSLAFPRPQPVSP